MDDFAFDIGPHTPKRLEITLRQPNWPVPDPDVPYVLAEADDGSGLAVAVFGPDSPASRADAEHVVSLWNNAFDRRRAAPSESRANEHSGDSPSLGAMALRVAMTAEGWSSEDQLTRHGWRSGFGYSIWFKRSDWHGRSALALTGHFAVFHAHIADAWRAEEAVRRAAALARRAWAEFPDCPPRQGHAGELVCQTPIPSRGS